MINHKKELFFGILIIALILEISSAIAAEEFDVYAIKLNYQKDGEKLNLISVFASEGSVNAQHTLSENAYTLQMTSSENTLLDSIKFEIPVASAMFKGLTKQVAHGAPKNLNFTLAVPYHAMAVSAAVYNNKNEKILEIPLRTMPAPNPDFSEITGRMEVEIADNFENLDDSTYYFYLIANDKRYTLESDFALPTFISGTNVKVTGKIIGDAIYVESLARIEEVSSQNKEGITFEEGCMIDGPAACFVRKHTASISSAIIILILVIISIIELKRRREHATIISKQNEYKNKALRDYAAKSLKKGFTKEQIRNALIKNDYDYQEIEEAFRRIK